MELEQALKIMENWQHWRRCNNERCHCAAVNATELGQANDVAIIVMREKLASKNRAKKC